MRVCNLIVVLLALALTLCGGCATQRIDALAQALNDRQVTSCISAQGAYGMFLGVSILTATGGATIDQCRGLR